MHDPHQITYLAETDARGKRVRFGIKADDRTKHIYVIGKSGMGKSTFLENMAVQDIQNGNGLAFMDPHGGSAELLLAYIPEERKKDVLYIAPFDTENPVGFNILEDIGPDKRHLVVSGIMSVFKKLWVDSFSARMEYFLTNTLLALLEYPGATLLHVNRMYSDKAFRDEVITHITDPAIRAFWIDEWGGMTERFIAEATPAIQNKIGQFTANPVLRNILGQAKSSFDFRKLMDERKIIIVNLSKGLIGETNADLLGSLIVTKLYLAAMSRADVGKFNIDALPNFYLYVDEFQSFSNESFSNILSEARKYKLNLTIAHQYIEQMEDTVRAAVFGNVGTTVTFRVGGADAEPLEKEFAPVFLQEDLVNLGKYQIYLKLMIDGVGSAPFSATTLPPLPRPSVDLTQDVLDYSKTKYGMPKAEVEAEVNKMVFTEKEKKGKSGGNSHQGNQNKNNHQKGGQQKSIPQKSQQNQKSHQNKTERQLESNSGRDKKMSTPPPPRENPEPPPLSEKPQNTNPFKVALKQESFAQSITQKAAYVRKEEEHKKNTKEISTKDLEKQKKYRKDKGTEPERRNTLQEALAALKLPNNKSVVNTLEEDRQEKKEELFDQKENNRQEISKSSKESHAEKDNSKAKTLDTDKSQNQNNSETRNVKVPAHISDEQLEKLLKITEKDLELDRER